MYCNRGSLAAEETILQYSLVGSRFVLQYKLYCELGVGPCHDTARAGAGRTQLGAVTQRWALRHGQARTQQGAATLHRARDRGGRPAAGRGAGRHGRAVGSRGARGMRQGARPSRVAGPVGSALGALSLF